ncbi:MAG: histone [Candidatus Micrarchaeaceae archaeon]
MYIKGSTIKKILREAGASRMSEQAVSELQKHLNKVAFDVAYKAVRLSRHAKRKTIDISDIKLACS